MHDGANAPPPADRGRFERTLEELAARRAVAQVTLQRMRDAVERSRRLLQETAGVLTRVRPPSADGGADPPAEEPGGV